MRHRAAIAHHRLGSRGFNLVPLLQLAALFAESGKGEIRRGTVGIDVGKAARQHTTAAHLIQRFLDIPHHAGVECVKLIPRNRALGSVEYRTHGGHGRKGVGHADKGVAPVANRAAATGSLSTALNHHPVGRRAAQVRTALKRAVDPGFERMVRGFKAEHEQAAARPIADIVPFDLGRIENATVGGIQARLTEQSNCLNPILKLFKVHRG